MFSLNKSYGRVCLEDTVFFFFLFFFGIDQLVQKGLTEAVSSTTHASHRASFAVDGDFSQKIQICSHTAIGQGIREAWLRIDLRDIYSRKSVKFWYRGDSEYNQVNIHNPNFISTISVCYTQRQI